MIRDIILIGSSFFCLSAAVLNNLKPEVMIALLCILPFLLATILKLGYKTKLQYLIFCFSTVIICWLYNSLIDNHIKNDWLSSLDNTTPWAKYLLLYNLLFHAIIFLAVLIRNDIAIIYLCLIILTLFILILALEYLFVDQALKHDFIIWRNWIFALLLTLIPIAIFIDKIDIMAEMLNRYNNYKLSIISGIFYGILVSIAQAVA